MDVREKSSNGKRLIDAIDAWNRRAGEEGKQSDLMYRLEMEVKEK